MISRDYLYVDTDKVRGLLAQISGGIDEVRRTTERDGRDGGLGIKNVADFRRLWGTETHVDRSLGDALFPRLEEELEALGLLHDLSEELQDQSFWDTDLRSEYPPGALLRVTARGSLFDARYFAASLASFATAAIGIHELSGRNTNNDSPVSLPQARSGKPGRKAPSKKVQGAPSDSSSVAVNLEDSIPDFEASGPVSGISAAQLRGMVKTARGVFAPGVHLSLTPTLGDAHVIGVRLQEGRQFLDSDAEVLFARYGTAEQEWTAVGTVGHYAARYEEDLDFGDLMKGNKISRIAFLRAMNKLMSFVGTIGLLDLPRYPGFTLIPLAVYRTMPRSEQDSVDG